MNASLHVVRDPRLASRLKLAELTSSLGAGVLGAGIGVLLAAWLGGLALPILAVYALARIVAAS